MVIKEANPDTWIVETESFAYHAVWTKLTELANHRIRVGWYESFLNAVEYFKVNSLCFETFIASDFLLETEETISRLPSILTREARIYLLENASSETEFLQKLSKLNTSYRIIKIENITSEAVSAIKNYVYHRHLNFKLFNENIRKAWFFIEAETIQ